MACAPFTKITKCDHVSKRERTSVLPDGERQCRVSTSRDLSRPTERRGTPNPRKPVARDGAEQPGPRPVCSPHAPVSARRSNCRAAMDLTGGASRVARECVRELLPPNGLAPTLATAVDAPGTLRSGGAFPTPDGRGGEADVRAGLPIPSRSRSGVEPFCKKKTTNCTRHRKGVDYAGRFCIL